MRGDGRRVDMPLEKRGTSCGFWGRLIALFVAALSVAAPASFAARAFDARRVEPSVYKIYTFIPAKNNQFSISSGSGFLISGRRYVVTNFHVIEGGARFYIAFRSGREAKLVEARLAEKRPNVDLALLEAREDLPGEVLKLGEYEPEKLAEVVAIGFPGAANLNRELVPGADAQGVPLTDLDSTVTTGIVSRMTFTNLKVSESQILSARTVQHNSAINPGNSGGPLFDSCGLVVGVNTLQGLNSQGLFFSIHAGEVGRFLREGQIPFSYTTRACGGTLSSSLVPLAVGLTAALALAVAAFLLRRERAPAWLEAIPRGLARLAASKAGGSVKKKPGQRALPASASAGDLCLRPVEGGPPIRLDVSGRALTIGRGPGSDRTVASDTVSKIHARLAYDRKAERIRITDLGSSNGTYLNGARIAEADAALGAHVRLGTVEYTVARELRAAEPASGAAARGGWMLSGFDPSGRAVQFELRPATDKASGRELPATWTFGRDPSRANFVIDDSSVSALHAQLMYNPGEALMLRDIGSMNGTRLDGESIGGRTVTLRDTGPEIAFGLAALRLSRLTG
ncbi:FHA domain-containing protein [Hyphomicrobium sp.]|uniref:FHA domain-containing protein n=1 Tax=Hyphomicrobium sp. TaxID=82 RepID=UPI0025B814F1|nr:FHA domain-containing protein [Hyphomicrobium sp.]MCC7252161.1 FHA domain-containing protein [Hyphomicrobium sp.]